MLFELIVTFAVGFYFLLMEKYFLDVCLLNCYIKTKKECNFGSAFEATV